MLILNVGQRDVQIFMIYQMLMRGHEDQEKQTTIESIRLT